MRMTGTNSHLSVALNVLKRIDIPSKDVSIRTYSNCREQGLHIVHWNGKDFLNKRAVSFAENRNSDDIVVLFGKQEDFDEHGVMKTDELWESNRKYFAYKDYEGAAKFITKYLRSRAK